MIAARKSRVFNVVLHLWLSALLRRRFHNIYVIGTENLLLLDAARPVVGCVNHTNWWDGFILYVLSHRRLPHDVYLAMEERNLARYPFLSWMGAFGLDLASPRAVLPGLRYAVKLLRSVALLPRLVWIFVQGKLLDPRLPIEAKPGAGFLALRAEAQLLPLVLRYEWLMESRPSIFVHIGRPLSPDTSAETLGATLNALFVGVEPVLDASRLSACDALFPPRMSMNKRWDSFASRFLRRARTLPKELR